MSANALNRDILSFDEKPILFQTSPCFYIHVCKTNLLKTLGKEEIAQRAISPFPSVFF